MPTGLTGTTSGVTTSEIYWKRAFEELTNEEKSILSSISTRKVDILCAVRRVAERKRQLCIRRQWKFCVAQSSDEIILRDLMDRVVAWVEGSESIENVVCMDSTVYTVLPWTAALFLLRCDFVDVEVFGLMLIGLETITRLLYRFKGWERLQLRSADSNYQAFQSDLSRLKAGVYRWLSKAVSCVQYLTRESGDHYFLGHFDNDPIIAIAKLEIEACKKATELRAQMPGTDHFRLDKNLFEVNIAITRVIDTSSTVCMMLDESEMRDVLDWVSATNTTAHHERLNKEAIPGSGEWVFGHNEYRQWLISSSSATLLIHGVPGCGKSVLFSVIMESLCPGRSTNMSRLGAPRAFFYCSDSPIDSESNRPEAIFRSIVRQLAVHPQQNLINETIWNKYETARRLTEKDRSLGLLDLEESINLILSLTASNPAYIGVDALNELSEESRNVILGALHRIARESQSVVKILLTSREQTQVNDKYSTRKIGICSEYNGKDVEVYCQMKLELANANKRASGGHLSVPLTKEISEILLAGAAEVFLWVRLQTEILFRQSTEQEISKTLSNGLADGLEDTYSRIFNFMNNMCHSRQRIFKRVFYWILYAKAPITSNLLFHVLELDKARVCKNPIQEVCYNLVQVDAKTDIVGFYHGSVREYALRVNWFPEQEAHEILAIDCLRHCIRCKSIEPEDSMAERSYAYAATYWPDHVRGAGEGERTRTTLLNCTIEFIFNIEDEGEERAVSLPFLTWIDWIQQSSKSLNECYGRQTNIDTERSPENIPYLIASAYGLDVLLANVLEYSRPMTMKVLNEIGNVCVYIACANGHSIAVSRLLANGACTQMDPNNKGSPIEAACLQGHTNVVKTLLDYEIMDRPNFNLENTLKAAFVGKREEIPILLLTHNTSKLNMSIYELALIDAAKHGFCKLAAWLLSPEVRKLFSGLENSAPYAFQQATFEAIRNGHASILQLFISLDLSEKCKIPENSIAIASSCGKPEMVSFLYSMGKDVQAEGPLGSPLISACLTGHGHIVQQLFRWGLDARANAGELSPMQAAARRGHTHVLRLLLRNGATVGIQGHPPTTPLQTAAFYGHKQAVSFLLNEGADMYEAGTFKDAFYAAVKGGQDAIAMILLDLGYELDVGFFIPGIARSQWDITFVSCWSGKEPRKTGHQVSVNFRDPYSLEYLGALVYMAAHGSLSIVKLLLKRFFWSDEDMHEAMVIAASNGWHAIVQELIANGLKHVQRPTSTIYESLEAAAINGYPDVVETLFQELLARDPRQLRSFISQMRWDINNSQARGYRPADSGVAECVIVLSPYYSWPSTLSALEAVLSSTFSKGHREIFSRALSFASSRHSDIAREPGWIGLSAAYGRPEDLKRYMEPEAGYTSQTSSRPGSRPSATLLIKAIKSGNVDTACYLIPFLSPNEMDKDSHISAFLLVCSRGLASIALRLAEEKDKLGLNQHNISHGAYWAIAFGHTDLTMELVETHGGLNCLTDYSLGNALAIASNRGFGALVRRMLAVPSIRNRKGFCEITNKCLVLSCLSGDKEMVEMCLENGAQIDSAVSISGPDATDEVSYNKALDHFSVQARFEPFPQVLDREHGRSLLPISAAEYTNSLQAALEGYSFVRTRECVTSYIEDLAELRDQERRRDGIVLLLLDRGCDPNGYLGGDYRWPLHYAAFYTNEFVVQALLDAGADITREAENNTVTASPIELACNMSSFVSHGVVLRLLKAGISIPTTDEGYLTPGMLRVLEYSLKPLNMVPKGLWDLTSYDSFAPELCQRVMGNGIGELIQTIFRMLPTQGADTSVFGKILHLAAIAGDAPCTRLLVKHGADVNFSIKLLGTCLNVAARTGEIEVIKNLLQAGADPGLGISHSIFGGHLPAMKLLLEQEGSVAKNFHFFVASIQDDESFMECLLEATADNEAYQTGKNSALGIACHLGKASLAAKMIANDANINTRCLIISLKDPRYMGQLLYSPQSPVVSGLIDKFLSSPLYAASDHGSPDIVRMLIDKGADVNLDIGTGLRFPLVVASSKGNLDVVKVLLEAGAHPDDGELLEPNQVHEKSSATEYNDESEILENNVATPLWEACRNGFRDVVKELLSYQGRVSGPPRFPNTLLSVCGSHETPSKLEILELLLGALDDGEDAQNALMEAFHSAMRSRCCGAIELLLEYMPNIDSDLLIMASLAGSLSGIRIILSRGVSVCAPHSGGLLPLHSALFGMNIEAARFLLINGADLNQIDGMRRTPLESLLAGSAALLTNNGDDIQMLKNLDLIPDITKTLLDRGCELRLSGSELQMAAYIGCIKTVRLLLDNGATVNSTGGKFGTALFAALEGNQPQVVELLIQQGADPNLSRELEEGDPRLSFEQIPSRETTTQSPFETALGNPSPELLERLLTSAADSLEISDSGLDTVVRASIWQQQPCKFAKELSQFDLQTLFLKRPDTRFSEDVICTLIKDLGDLFGFKMDVLRMVLDNSMSGVTQKMLDCATQHHLLKMLKEYQGRGDVVYSAQEFRTRSALEAESEERSFLRPGYIRHIPSITDSYQHATHR